MLCDLEFGCVAEMAASRKEAKYATLRTHYDFQPIAVETTRISAAPVFNNNNNNNTNICKAHTVRNRAESLIFPSSGIYLPRLKKNNNPKCNNNLIFLLTLHGTLICIYCVTPIYKIAYILYCSILILFLIFVLIFYAFTSVAE